jgi:exosortase H (IPTLxxWG-CTERM-specific)
LAGGALERNFRHEFPHGAIEPAAAPGFLAVSMRTARFAVIFAGCLLCGIGVLLTPPVQAVDRQFSRVLVKVSHGLIGICGGKARVEGAVLRDPASGFAVEMRDGCNAVNVTIMLWSAVLAFPAPWRLKVLGLLAGSLLIQALNIVRFISLFYIGQYSMTWFDFAHGYLWESLLVLDTMVVFCLWANRASRYGAVPNDGR